jgi:putative endonuclease
VEPFYVYILRCSDKSLYTGYTNHLQNRLSKHNTGKGAKYTRARLPVTLVYFEEFPTKQEAMKREIFIKKMKKSEKEKIVSKS